MKQFKVLWCLLLLCFLGSCQTQGLADVKKQVSKSSPKPKQTVVSAKVPTPVLKWNDRRPIGTLFLGNSPAYTPNNPRKWLNSQDLNLFTVEGKREFKARMMSLTDNTIKYMKDMNAQGLIVFDIEGIEAGDGAYTWVGDPRLLKERAPEMDEIADELFKKIRDSGFRVGVTIRAQFMYPYKTPLPTNWWKTDKNTAHYWGYKKPEDAIEGISDKIAYAKKRWGATLFYIDSNNEQWANVIASVQQRFPDTLIIPEHTATNPVYLDFSAPLERVDGWYIKDKPDYRKNRPNGFKAILIRDPKKFEDKYKVDLYTYLLPKVKAGDILMINAWYPSPYNEVVKKLYRDVYGEQCCTRALASTK
jgi:hypothetical protein